MSQTCQHGRIYPCLFCVTTRSVHEAIFALAGGVMPLRYGKDRVFVSPEAIGVEMASDLRAAVSVDPRLHGLEMRLERAKQ